MYYFYSYGFQCNNIEEQKIKIENYLGYPLGEKKSSYYNLAFSFRNNQRENFLLQENYDGEDFIEKDYKDYPIIFKATIKGLDKAEELKKKILSQEGTILIKSRKLSMG